MAGIADIDTLVVVIMENRSFDHALGYRSLKEFGGHFVDGLQDDPAWLASVANPHGAGEFSPFHQDNPALPYDDPPHERAPIAMQLATGPNGVPTMKGFVDSYSHVFPGIDSAGNESLPGSKPPVMGYFTPLEVPTFDFLADQFAISDRWFSCIPAGTQPNRLMAMSGYTRIAGNADVLDDQLLVYDWLTQRGVRWRIYHDGAIPFFTLMPSKWPTLMSDACRSFGSFAADWHNESVIHAPQVVFIEPAYRDAKAHSPNDDHPPCAIGAGQDFLRRVYEAVIASPQRWAKTLVVITYDEHGGFFDHVPPPPLRTDAPSAEYPVFETLGVRVPAFVLSPFVERGVVVRPTTPAGAFDHTSILKFMGEKWGGGSYSSTVDARRVASLSEFLVRATARTDTPTFPQEVATVSQLAFQRAAQNMLDQHGGDALEQFPRLFNVAKVGS